MVKKVKDGNNLAGVTQKVDPVNKSITWFTAKTDFGYYLQYLENSDENKQLALYGNYS